MSLHYSPDIVTNGLVLCLDAGDPRSYSGSGTVWTDRSGSGNNGTLVNGVGYSSENRGNMLFDGVNDHILLPVNFFSYPSLTTFTISLWFRSSQTTGGTLFGQQNTNNPSSANGWVPVIYLTTSGLIRIEPFWTGGVLNFINNSTPLNDNKWHNISTTYNNGVNQLYVDGVYITQRTGLGLNSFTTTYNYIIGAGFSAARGLGTHFFNGSISQFLFYNRALSPVEIQQNFEMQRSRFNV